MKRKHKNRLPKLIKLKRLHDLVWNIMSRYIRLRDSGQGCISCGCKIDYENSQAGHLWHGDNMDFFYQNVNAQCQRCNHHLHGNTGMYVIAVEKKWGIGTAERLLSMKRKAHKYTRSELCQIKEELENKIALLLTDKLTE